MGDSCDRRNVFNDAEKVRALNKNGGGLIGDGRFERLQVDAPGFLVVTNETRRQSLMLRIGREHLAIFRVNR